MKRIWTESNLDINATSATVSVQELNHLLRVLRARTGEAVELINGRGEARIFHIPENINLKNTLTVHLEETPDNTLERSATTPLIVRIGLFKDARWDILIEKLSELGVRRIEPLFTEYSVVKISPRDFNRKKEKWDATARAAYKQSGRLTQLEIASPQSLQEALSRPILENSQELLFDPEASLSLSSISHSKESLINVLWIGPEGGWSPKEQASLKERSQAISLGPLILRAETAAISVASYLRFASF